MAVYIANADGNLSSAAGVWATVDATSYLYSAANNTALTTSYVESQSFIPGAITIDAIAVLVASRAASPTGTISIRLAQGGATVAGTEVTINVSDIDADGTLGPGLYLFKFAAPVLLVAATAYTVSAKTSSASQVNLFRNATAGNWSRMLRTTTTGNPGAADEWHVLGEYTAAGTKTDRVITQDETAVTDYGSGSTDLNLQSVRIGKGGTLVWGNAAATNYVLQISGGLAVQLGGTHQMGTVGSPVPTGATATLQFDCAADGDFGVLCAGTWIGQGQPRTVGKTVVAVLLNTDEAAGQTVLGIGPKSGAGTADPGWKSGDSVLIGSTSRTFSQAESKVLASDANASDITITVALANAHSGTSPTQALVVLMTRNVVVKSVSTTAMSFALFGPNATVDCDWVRFQQLGTSTDFKRGVQLNTTSSGSLSFDYCAITDFEQYGIYMGGAGAPNYANIALRNTVIASGASATIVTGLFGENTTGTGITISDLDVAHIGGTGGNRSGIEVAESDAAYGITWSNIRVTSCTGQGAVFGNSGDFSGLRVNSCGGIGVRFSGAYVGYLSGLYVWRCNNPGVDLTGNTGWLVVDTGQIFGNATRNITLQSSVGYAHFKNLTIAGDTTFSVPEGCLLNGTSVVVANLIFENCSFGPTSGIFVPHTSEDIDCGNIKQFSITLRDTLLQSATEIANQANGEGRSVIHYQRVDGATNVHKSVYPALGTVQRTTGTFRTASPSEELAVASIAPGAHNFRLRSGVRAKPVASGETVSFSVWVRKNAAYNGDAPRLLILSNAAVGIDSDVVGATFSAGPDVWQLLSYTTVPAAEDGVVQACVEANGNAGSAFTEDWS